MQKHECQNCRKRWPAGRLGSIADIDQRVMAGEPMPSGECPECGALCHPVPARKRLTRQVRDVRKSDLFRSLERVLSDHRGDGMLDDETALADALATMRHVADKQKIDWSEVERRGYNHHDCEVRGIE